MAIITRRAALFGAAAVTLPRFAIAQADQRPVLTIAVQKISNSNTFEPPREQSNVGYRLSYSFAETLIDSAWQTDLSPVPGLATAWRRIDDDRIDVRDGYSERPDPNDPPESPHLGLSIALAREQLRWRPTWTAAEAVTQTAAWYRAFLTEHADARDLTLAQIAAFTSHARERGRAWSAPTLDHAS